MLIYNNLSHENKSVTFTMKFKKIINKSLLKKLLFCGRICDYWSLMCKICVNDVFYGVTICALYMYAAFD